MAYMTQEGYNKMVAQLRQMETIERPKASAAIAEARARFPRLRILGLSTHSHAQMEAALQEAPAAEVPASKAPSAETPAAQAPSAETIHGPTGFSGVHALPKRGHSAGERTPRMICAQLHPGISLLSGRER